MVELASAVGGGKLDKELDLDKLAQDVEAEEVKYDPGDYNGLILRLDAEGPAVIIYRSGAFSISGASSLDELRDTFTQFENLLYCLFEEDVPGYEIEFEVRNMVFMKEYDNFDSPINLSHLVISLGMENVEYEPEQFPGIFYRPSYSPGLFLIFGTGNLVLTGVRDWESAKKSFQQVTGELEEVFSQK